MNESRRGFVKKAALAGAITTVGAISIQAGSSSAVVQGANGVVKGKSPKKEVTYKKSQAWEDYYKSAL